MITMYAHRRTVAEKLGLLAASTVVQFLQTAAFGVPPLLMIACCVSDWTWVASLAGLLAAGLFTIVFANSLFGVATGHMSVPQSWIGTDISFTEWHRLQRGEVVVLHCMGQAVALHPEPSNGFHTAIEILRWLLVVPAAFTTWIGTALAVGLMQVIGEEFTPTMTEPAWWWGILGVALPAYTGTRAGAFTAPSAKLAVAVGFAALTAIVCTLGFATIEVTGFFTLLARLVAGVGASILAVVHTQQALSEDLPTLADLANPTPQPTSSSPLELHQFDKTDGRLLMVDCSAVPGCSDVVFAARDSEGNYQKTTAPIVADSNGDLVLSRPVRDAQVTCFIPWGARVGREFLSLQALDTMSNVLGESRTAVEWPDRPLLHIHFWRPLAGLAMAVSRADGVVDKREIRTIRNLLGEGLEIPHEEAKATKAVLKSEPSAEIESLVAELHLRAPSFDPITLLRLLAAVALADGQLAPSELAIIQEVATLHHFTGERWEALAQELGLVDPPDVLTQARTLLDVGPHATPDEIKKAYRTKMVDYHPDKYANHPPEFQEVANRMAQGLNAARELLLAECR